MPTKIMTANARPLRRAPVVRRLLTDRVSEAGAVATAASPEPVAGSTIRGDSNPLSHVLEFRGLQPTPVSCVANNKHLRG